MAKLRKIFTISVMLVTVLSMSVVVAPQVDAAASAGDLIKMDGLSSVYYLGADGKRYVFPNESTYFSWYSDFSGVVTIPQSELESYPLGANVTVRPGTKLVKITTNPKVYAVESNGTLVGIPDEATAKALYGDNWASRVIDVADSFFTNYKISESELSATAYPEGSLIKTADSGDIFYVNADGTLSKIANEAAFYANRFKMSDVITVDDGFTMPETTGDITGADSEIADTSQGGGTTPGITPGAGTGLTVSLASDTPASASLPAGASGVAFTKVNFTAANDGDVTIKNLVVNRIGIGSASDFSGVWIYDAEGNRLTSSRTVSSSSNTATFSGVNYVVPAGTTKALVVKATVTGISGNNGFAINAASNITTNGASVSGSFPVSGNIMSLTAVNAGALTYTLQSVENTSLKVGDTQAEVADIKLQETSSNEDISVESITFTNDGAADANDLVNFKLYQGSTLVAQKDSTATDRVMMTLDTPLVISKGSSKNFSLKADIRGGVATSGSIVYDIDDLTDVVAVGNSYGFGVAVTAAGGTSSIAVAAGELTVEIDGPAAYDVVADIDDAVIANLTFTTGGDEVLEVKTLYGVIDGTASTTPPGGLSSAIENVQLVNVDNGDYYDVTADDGSTTDDEYFFKVTNFSIPAGVSNWRIEADLIEAKIGSGDKFAFVMYAGDDVSATYTGITGTATASSGKKGLEIENQDGKALSDIKPGAEIRGNNVTVQTPTLTIANSTLSDGDAVSRTQGVELLRFSAAAGSSESIKMTQVALQATSSAVVLTDASNYTLKAEDGTVLQSGVSSVAVASPGLDTVTFSSLKNGGYIIPEGETKIFIVTADINSTVTGAQIAVEMQTNGVSAEESDGDALSTTAVSGEETSSDVRGRTITLRDQGTITFTVDNSSPTDGHILLSSTEDASILKFKADASYEDIVLKDLRFSISGEGTTQATSSIASLELWQDGEMIKEVATKDDSYGWVFTNLEAEDVIVAKDTDSIFEIKMNVAGIGDGATDTASSGADITVTLLDDTAGVVARGYSSNNDLGATEITATSVASQKNYVYGSKVTASKASSQPTSLSTGTKEVLKFTLTPSSNDSKNASFTDFDMTVGFSGGAATTTSVAYLYSGSTLVATSSIVSTSQYTGTATDFKKNGVAFSDEISASGETYTVKLDLYTDGSDDQVTTSFTINGGYGNDEITWNDGVANTGNISWIDLPEGSDVTSIENTINN
jgi:hypothetical protein